MLFFAFLAALAGSSGWLLFWSIMGFLFSSRSFVWFILPLIAAVLDNTSMGVASVLFAWFTLSVMSVMGEASRQKERARVEALLRARGIDTSFLKE